MPYYPAVKFTINLNGDSGNSYDIMRRVARGLKQAGASSDECDAYREESMEGDFAHLKATAQVWADITFLNEME